MKPWKKVVLMNGAWAIGVLVSIFILPPSTPVWLWDRSVRTIIVVFNCLLFMRKQVSIGERKVGLTNTLAGSLAFLILLF